MFKKLFLLALLFGFSFGDELDNLIKKCNNNNDSKACLEVSLNYERTIKDNNKKYELQKPFLENACKLNNGSGCHNLGLLYLINKDYDNAENYLKIGCDDLSYELSCRQLGLIYEEKNKKKAKYYYKKACKLGSQLSCNYAKEL